MGPVSHDLIDTTEMYLRTIYELGEEGIPAVRARIAERLDQSAPTVSETVARMERDGLLTLADGRVLQLTNEGKAIAEAVMRKHRLAERMLVDILGMDIDLVHDEACRWEHVMSDAVEKRIIELLDCPTESPFGNPIPALERLGQDAKAQDVDVVSFATAATIAETTMTLRRIAEHAQDAKTLADLKKAGISIGTQVTVSRINNAITIAGPTGTATIALAEAASLYGTLLAR